MRRPRPPVPSAALRVALALVWMFAPLVPRRHRARWRQQWRADLWYQATAAPGASSTADLLVRALGVFPHASALRFHDWRNPMLLHDIRYALRTLVRRPGFTAVAVLTLALGVGANTTIFSWIDTMAFDTIPAVEGDDRFVALQFAQGSRNDLSFSYPNYVDVRDAHLPEFTGVAAYDLVALNVRIGDEPERVWGQIVTANLFDVLGVPAALGRTLQPSDDRALGASPVLVISDALWRRRFAADPQVVGRTLAINSQPFTVVGVAPPRFIGPMNGLAADVWLPMTMQTAVVPGDRLNARGQGWLQAFGRLAPGVSRRQAQAAVDVVAARLAQDHPGTNEGRRLVVAPMWSDGAGGLLLPLLGVVMGVVAVVLLIACANVAGLLLARASGRQREIAVRLAIGASRGRLVRQLLTEAAVLAVAGGAAGLLLTIWTSRLFTALLPPMPFPVHLEGSVNWRVFLFAMGATLATALVFGLVPALASSRPSVVPSLKDSAGATGGGRARLRKGLVVAQVALAVVLLVSAGLFVRTLQHANEINPGFDARQGFFARLDLQAGDYDVASGPAFYRDLLERVEAVPGVSRVTLGTFVPLTVGGGSDTSARIEGYEPADNEQMTIFYSMVAPGYFETLGIPLVRGRGVEARDTADAPLAVVINETMARRYWKDGVAIGKRLDYGGGGWATVVGVARDGKYNAINEPPRNYLYIPVYQVFRPDVALMVRTAGDPGAVFPSVQLAVRALNPNLPLYDVMSIEEHLRTSVFIPRLAAWLLGLFGTLAMALASLGLYGVIAYVASQRTQEIGIRMALGADRAAILKLILRQGLSLVGVGIVVGLALATLATPLVASQLVGVEATDAVTFAITVAILMLAAMIAIYVPARRAAGLDPLRALRHE
jgi:macrolide transport system ATP-binding/permease protein